MASGQSKFTSVDTALAGDLAALSASNVARQQLGPVQGEEVSEGGRLAWGAVGPHTTASDLSQATPQPVTRRRNRDRQGAL